MKKVYRVFIPPPKIWSETYEASEWLTVKEICQRANYTYRVTGPEPPKVILYHGDNGIAYNKEGEKLYLVDVREIDLNSEVGWEMVLETLAYGFLDYATRESVRHT